MKKQKGFLSIELLVSLTISIIMFSMAIYFNYFYKAPEVQIYEGKIQFEKYFASERQFCSIRIENRQLNNIPIEKCLFLNNEKEYIVRTNGWNIEIKEKE